MSPRRRPQDVLTPELVRGAGFAPGPAPSEADDTAAHVWYDALRDGQQWQIGLGVFLPGPPEAEAYWADLVAEADQPVEGVVWHRPAVAEAAIFADGWLYLRWRGHVLWTVAEGPDGSVARQACESLAREVCDRVEAETRWVPGPAR